MNGMDDLIAWLRAQLDEDEQLAREASRRNQDGSTPTGEHWRWEETEHDQVLTLAPMLDEYLNEGGNVALRSAEQYPTRSVGDLPHMVVPYAQEVRTVDAMHIARWDPARVLAEVEAKRRILDMVVPGNYYGGYGEAYLDAVRELAQPYAGRPGWREEWATTRPE
jgi:hypothetical protein